MEKIIIKNVSIKLVNYNNCCVFYLKKNYGKNKNETIIKGKTIENCYKKIKQIIEVDRGNEDVDIEVLGVRMIYKNYN